MTSDLPTSPETLAQREHYHRSLTEIPAVLHRSLASRICRRLTRRLVWPLLAPLLSAASKRFAVQAAEFNRYFFDELGVSRDEVERAYAAACAELNLHQRPHESIHRKCFVALSLAGFSPRNILEIGTESADVTRLLVHLFPEATVHTVELGADDPFYAFFHWQGAEAYERELAAKLDHPRIRSLRANTLWLMARDLPDFDLIWLDGGHEYPEVAWDHFYCLHKLAPGGWLFSDDVIAPASHHRQCDPNAGDVWNTIRYINARIDDEFKLLLKRERAIDLVRDRKFVAFMRKSKTCASLSARGRTP